MVRYGHASGNAGHKLIELWVVPKLLEVSELWETDLAPGAQRVGPPVFWRRHFFMELKTSGSSISSESFESSDGSDSTCSTSM